MVDILDYSWHIKPPAPYSGRTATQYYKKTMDWHNVTPTTVKQWRNITGTRRVAEQRWGKPIEEITNEELAQSIVENVVKKRSKMGQRTRKLHEKEMRVGPKSESNRAYSVDSRLEDYLKHYECKTANDLSTLRQLCALEIAIEETEKIENTLLKSLQKPDKREAISDSYINSVTNTRVRYLTEYRQLQQILGIDRLTRDKRESEQGGTDYLKQLMVSSRDLLESKTSKIVCKKCQTEGTLLQMGFVMCHFKGWKFSVNCPKCASVIELHG